MQNLTKQSKKHNTTKYVDTENTVVVAGEGGGGMGEGGQEVQTSVIK